MNQNLQQFITQIVDATQLHGKARDELIKELSIHVLEQEKELQLQGYSEEKIAQIIEQRFGNTEHIAHELTFIHLIYMDKNTKLRWLAYATGILFLLLYLHPDNPIAMVALLTGISAFILLWLFPKKCNILGIQYVLSLAVVLFFIAIPLTHQPVGNGYLYGTIGFPLRFYNDLVGIREFTLLENYFYFIIDYIFFAFIALGTYYLGVRKFLNRHITLFLTFCAVVANFLLFWWLLNVFD